MAWKPKYSAAEVPTFAPVNEGPPPPGGYQVGRILSAKYEEKDNGKRRIHCFVDYVEWDCKANLDIHLPSDGDDEKKAENKEKMFAQAFGAFGIADAAALPDEEAMAAALVGRIAYGRVAYDEKDDKKYAKFEFPVAVPEWKLKKDIIKLFEARGWEIPAANNSLRGTSVAKPTASAATGGFSRPGAGAASTAPIAPIAPVKLAAPGGTVPAVPAFKKPGGAA